MRIAVLSIVLLCGGCWGSATPTPTPSPTAVPVPQENVFDSGDKLLDVLRDRVRSKVGAAQDDFQVIVTDFGYPVGTIMPEGRSIALNRSACKPAQDAGTFAAPSMFSTYAMDGKVAFEFGLDSAAIAQLASFGVKGGGNDVVQLSVADTTAQFLLDDELKEMVSQPSCRQFLQGGAYLLVRGYVAGRRNYLLQRDRSVGGDIGVRQIASFKVDGSSSNSVGVSDAAPTQFLQIVSKVSIPPATGPTVAPNQTKFTVSRPTLPVGRGRIYVQRDTADSSGNADKVVAALAGQSMNVVQTVEAIPSAKVPLKAQVKYFNAGDAALAGQVVASLKQFYPDAEARFIGLRSPAGQLEIWLPRAGAVPFNPAAVRAIRPDAVRMAPKGN